MTVNRSATMFVCQLPEWEQHEFAARAWVSIMENNTRAYVKFSDEEIEQAMEGACGRRICDVSEFVDNEPFINGTVAPLAFDGEELLKAYEFCYPAVYDEFPLEECWTLEPKSGAIPAAYVAECPSSGYTVFLTGNDSFSDDGEEFLSFAVQVLDTEGVEYYFDAFDTYHEARNRAIDCFNDCDELSRVSWYDYSGRC